jgi:hypothetical protein
MNILIEWKLKGGKGMMLQEARSKKKTTEMLNPHGGFPRPAGVLPVWGTIQINVAVTYSKSNDKPPLLLLLLPPAAIRTG